MGGFSSVLFGAGEVIVMFYARKDLELAMLEKSF
jgi:hypothetical protein